MKRFLPLLLFFVIASGGFAVADEPQKSSEESTEIPYENESFWTRFKNLKTPSLGTENEVRLGLGLMEAPHVNMLYNSNEYSGMNGEYHSASMQTGRDYFYLTPSVGFMSRSNFFGSSFEWGATGFVGTLRQNLYSTVTTDVLRTHKSDYLYLVPTLRWNFLRNEFMTFYIHLGCLCSFEHEYDSGVYGDFEPFLGYGYTIGKRIFFFAEGSYYDDILINTIGIGYRF